MAQPAEAVAHLTGGRIVVVFLNILAICNAPALDAMAGGAVVMRFLATYIHPRSCNVDVELSEVRILEMEVSGKKER